MKSLRQRTVASLWWSATTQILCKGVQFAATVVLARLLSPVEFGLIGMIVVMTGFAASIADMGLEASIIQRQSLSDEHLNSAFWVNLGIGGALTLAFVLAAPLIARFYGVPELRLLTMALALNFLLGSFSIVQNALLQKSLQFRNRFWIETIAVSVSGLVALALVVAGAGVWSLAGQALCETVTRSAVAWRLSRWRPRLAFDWSAAGELLGFGRHIVASSIVGYCAQNVDKLVIGHQIGGTALGLYNLADRLMRTPLTNITAMTGNVMFPALSTLADNVESMKRAYLQANRLIALLTFPMMLGLSALAEPAILMIYGERWRDAIGIVQLLCFGGLAQSVYNTAGWIFLSRGRPEFLFWLVVLSMLTRTVGVLIGMYWGLPGIAGAYVLGGYICLLYPTLSAAGRLIDLRFIDLMKNVAAPFLCATVMATIIWISDRWLLSSEPNWLRILIQIPVGVLSYGLLIRGFRLQAWDDARQLILESGGQHTRLIQWLVGTAAPASPR